LALRLEDGRGGLAHLERTMLAAEALDIKEPDEAEPAEEQEPASDRKPEPKPDSGALPPDFQRNLGWF
jgi:hypothetical protein